MIDHRKAEFNRDSNCQVLSYSSISSIMNETYAGKDIYFIGDSLGTQQYLAANCDFEKENSSWKINFIGEGRHHTYLLLLFVHAYCNMLLRLIDCPS